MIFNTPEQFFSTIDKIGEMSEEELDDWEATNNFKSYRSVLNDANNEWLAMTDLNQIPLFEEKYKDILTVENDGILPIIKVGTLQSIVNREGIYETGGYLNKIARSNIYTVAKSESEKLNTILPEVEPCIQARIAQGGVTVFQYTALPAPDPCTDPEPNPPPPPPIPSCTHYMKASYFDNQSKCRDDREVYISAESFVYFYGGLTVIDGIEMYVNYHHPAVLILVRGKIRNWLCNWDYYNTRLQLRNISFTIDGWENYARDKFRTYSIQKSYNFSLPFFDTNSDEPSLAFSFRVGDELFNEPVNPFPFTKLHAEGTSRGVGYRWAIINCQ